jgi:predicted secreted protein
MARQAAKSLLLKIESSEGSGTYITLGMLKTADFTVNTNTVEVTNKDSTNDRRELDAGIQSLSASGTGFFDAGAAWQRCRAAVLGRETPNMQIIDPGDGTYQGRFLIQTFGKSGGEEGSVEVNCSIESSGDWTFTPV